MPDEYAQCVNNFEISPASLSCGLAVARGEPIVTTDVQEEPRWEPWLWMAKQFDFRGCWSFPIETVSGRFVGTFAMYFREPREPTPLDRELAAALTQTAAIIISRHQETEERARAENALRAGEERLRQFGEASSDVLWIRDAETLQWVYLTPAFEQIYGLDREAALQGDNLTGWLDLVVPEDRQRVLDSIQRVRAGERASFEYRIRWACDSAVRWLRDTDFPMRDASGKVCWIGGVGRDITEEKTAAERQDVLVKELQHRSRNLLAVVTSLANRTVGQGAPVESFTTRLKALSRAQALLSQSGSDTVEVGALVDAELAAHADGTLPRITVSGPKVLLTSQQMQNFALALHELATNAVKYGALKSETGQLSVTWERTRDQDGDGHLALNWIESGVDVQPEKVPRRGFGRELIEQALAYALQARTEYALGTDGVRCRIEMPLA